tara:strand:+ start:197 stop:388 length:192 start_codon:yes stop_codon:yes gene_type:complete
MAYYLVGSNKKLKDWVGTSNPVMSKSIFTSISFSSGLPSTSILTLDTLGSKLAMVSLIWSSIT